MMHQEPLIIDDFTVGENVWLYKLREGRDIRPGLRRSTPTVPRPARSCKGVGLGERRSDISPATWDGLVASGRVNPDLIGRGHYGLNRDAKARLGRAAYPSSGRSSTHTAHAQGGYAPW